MTPQLAGAPRLIRPIGSDGAAEVHEGLTESGEPVVVRRVLPALTRDPGRHHALQARLRDLRSVSHPLLLGVLDVIEEGDELWVVEERVEGTPLSALAAAARATGEPIAPALVLHVAAQLCNALEGLHGQPTANGEEEYILHLGLWPQSVLVTEDGGIKVGGFGLIRSPVGGPLGVLPSPERVAFLSPEQTWPDQRLGPPSDLFSLGAILYELLVGEPLFQAESALLTLEAIRRADVAEAVRGAAVFLPGIERVLQRALALNPRHRYQRAFVLREDLRGLMAAYNLSNVNEELARLAAGAPRPEPLPFVPPPKAGTLPPRPLPPSLIPADDERPPAPAPPVALSKLVHTADEEGDGEDLFAIDEVEAISAAARVEPAAKGAALLDQRLSVQSMRPPDVVGFAPPPTLAPGLLEDVEVGRSGAEPLPEVDTTVDSASEGAHAPLILERSSEIDPDEEHSDFLDMPEATDGALFSADDELQLDEDVPPHPAEHTAVVDLPAPEAPSAAPVPLAPVVPFPAPIAPVAPVVPTPAPVVPTPAPVVPAPAPLVAAPAPVAPRAEPAHEREPAPSPVGVARPASPPPGRKPPPPLPPMPKNLPPRDPEAEPPRGPPLVAIAGAVIGLGLVCGFGFALLAPSMKHRWVNEEEPVAQPVAEAPVAEAPVEPTPPVAEAPVEAPAEPVVAEAPPEPATPVAAEKPASKPVIAEKPTEPKPVAVAEKPASKPVAVAEKPASKPVAVAEKPASKPVAAEPKVVASAEKPSSKPSARATTPAVPTPATAVGDLALATTPAPESSVDFAAYAGPAAKGKLDPSAIMALETVETSDPGFTRARTLLLMDAERRGDAKTSKRYLDEIMTLPENRYNPIFLTEMARAQVRGGDYSGALANARKAEQHWARLPSELIFTKKAEIYEIQAAASQGLYYASGDNTELLDETIRLWERYKEHVSARGRKDLQAHADAELAELTELRKRLK